MTLSYAFANTLISQVNTSVGGIANIQFHTAGATLPTNYASQLLAGNGLSCSTVAIAATSATNATYVTRTFNAITSNTVSSAGSVALFSLNIGSPQATSDLVLWGSVSTTGADINFNTTVWIGSDNVAITSLTYTQPI
jgi:hypothetical protein